LRSVDESGEVPRIQRGFGLTSSWLFFVQSLSAQDLFIISNGVSNLEQIMHVDSGTLRRQNTKRCWISRFGISLQGRTTHESVL